MLINTTHKNLLRNITSAIRIKNTNRGRNWSSHWSHSVKVWSQLLADAADQHIWKIFRSKRESFSSAQPTLWYVSSLPGFDPQYVGRQVKCITKMIQCPHSYVLRCYMQMHLHVNLCTAWGFNSVTCDWVIRIMQLLLFPLGQFLTGSAASRINNLIQLYGDCHHTLY